VQTSKPTVEIIIEAPEPKVRHREPVTCGVPWPKGMLRDPDYLVLHDEKGESVLLQTRVLDRWADGSVRWLLLDWQATVNGDTCYRLCLAASASSDAVEREGGAGQIQIERSGPGNSEMTIGTGAALFHLWAGGLLRLESVALAEGQNAVSNLTIWSVQRELGLECIPFVLNLLVVEQGLQKVCVRLDGAIGRRNGQFEVFLHFFAGSANVRVYWAVCNPGRAGHFRGRWSLGAKKSLFFNDISFILKRSEFCFRIKHLEQEIKGLDGEKYIESLELEGKADYLRFQDYVCMREWAIGGTFRCSPERDAPFIASQKLFQNSSGGVNWQSSNHVNRR